MCGASCLLGSRQLTSLLLRWTNALGDGDGDGGENGVANDVASAKGRALLVAAGLKTVRIVCTKADNNKGELAVRVSYSEVFACAADSSTTTPKLDTRL